MPSFGQNIPELRAAHIKDANRLVGETRLRYITAIPGQDALYQAKLEEARAYIAREPKPDTLAFYPLLAAEVGLTAPDAYSLAQLWLNMNAMWSYMAAQMETLRLRAIQQISGASSSAEMARTVDALSTALKGFPGL